MSYDVTYNNLIKVAGHSNLVKDEFSGAILNTNQNEINQARLRKLNSKRKEEELQSMKDDISDLKVMIKSLIERIDNG